jgi:ornithine--oxo-acid transaminase
MPSKASAYIALDQAFGAHNYAPLPVVLARGKGAFVWDSDGKRYFDMLSAYSALNQGHCHPKIAAAARAQMGKVTLTSRAFHNTQMGPFLKRLCELTGQPKAILMNSGAEAVETAIKAMRLWGYRRKGIQPNQAEIIVMRGNFHGRTTTIVGFSSDPDSHEGFGPATPGFVPVNYGSAEDLEAAISERTCGVLLEPIQGEAGVVMPPEGYLRKVRAICDRHGILFCADEIQTGLGRTGKLLCVQHEGVVPDLVCLGKALSGGFYPISAVAGKEEVLGLFTPGTHGSTFGGNPLASAIGAAALDVLVKEKLPQRAAKLGALFLKKLQSLSDPRIREVRGKGLLLALEFKQGLAKEFCKTLAKNGLLAKDTHQTTVRFAPPLVITQQQLDAAFKIISKSLLVLLLALTARAEAWPDLSKKAKNRGGGQNDAAVIVGAENYAFVAKVPGARRNAQDWHAYLTESRKVPFERVALLRDNEATLEKLRKFAAKAAEQAKPGGTLWFVFIGHGAPSPDGKDGLLVGSDAQQEADGLFARSLPRSELISILAKGKQARTVVLIDACFSGRSSNGETLVAGLQPLVAARSLSASDPRLILLTAAKSDQFAGPLPKSPAPRPAFSYLALGGLRGWAAEGGKVTASGLVEYSQKALGLARDRTQTPELTGAGETVLAEGDEEGPSLSALDRGEEEKMPEKAEAKPVEKAAVKTKAAPADLIKWVAIPGAGFKIAKTEVTNEQYQACVSAGACETPDRCSFFGRAGEDDRPVTCVSQEQARAFSAWAGGRLPTEAEWQQAAVGAKKTPFPWGTKLPTCDTAVTCASKPQPVCSRPAGDTAQGVCDMIGNAREWVAEEKMSRGGSFSKNADALERQPAKTADKDLGFRPVRAR